MKVLSSSRQVPLIGLAGTGCSPIPSQCRRPGGEMKTRGQLGPWTRTSLSWNGWRDARGQMQPNEPPPRAGTYESVASARRQAIAVDSARDMEQPSATLAQLCADQNFLNDMLQALPEPQPCAEKPDTAVDAIAVTIRANARLAERRLALT